MKMLTLITVLSAVIAVALSAGCCTPDQWEGGEGVEVGYSGYIKKGLIREYVKVAYDYTNKRSAAELFYENGDIKGKFQMVIRYDDETDENKGKLYFVDLQKSKCWQKTLNKPFRKACVPDDAKEMGDYVLGLKSAGLKATAYHINGKGFDATVSVSPLGKGLCVPIGEIVAGKRGRFSTLRTVGFSNITPGIKNATVFDVPSACDETEYYDIMDEVSRDFYTFAL